MWWSRLVREADGITGPAKAVCWFLADVADKNGSSWYSQEQIALKAGVTDRTVRRALADLVVMDIVRVQPPTRQRRTPTVTLLADGLRGWVENPNDHGWTQSPGKVDRESTQVGQRVHPRRTQRPPTPDRESYEDPKKVSEEDLSEVTTEGPMSGREPDPDQRAEPEPSMPTDTPDSRPMTPTDAIDNDGAQTHPPGSAAPSLPRCGVRSLSSPMTCEREPHTDELHQCGPFAFSNDFYITNEVPDVQPRRASVLRDHAAPHLAAEDVHAEHAAVLDLDKPRRPEAPSVEAGDPRRAAGDASTLTAAPATTPATAPPPSAETGRDVAPRVGPDLPLTEASAFTLSPPSKPKGKRKAAPPLDLDAWGLACQSYDTIAGKTRRWDPARGDGRLIAETMAAQGQDRIVARFAQAARDPWCLDKRPDVSALCRAGSDFVRKLDAAAEQAALDAEGRSDASQTSGATLTRPTPENRSQGQTRPNDGVSWGDVLRDIGSDPQVHPEDGPHRHRWQSVRQAVIVAAKKPGDPWLNWCNADDRTRQHVEQLLERGLVKVSP